MELAEAGRLERAHVHAIYAQIAPSFDDARYGAWPRVRHFLQGQPPGSVIVDVGCGNGKYLALNGQAFTLGCDYCLPLVQASRAKGHEVMVSDNLRLPLRDGCADAVISIAVLHHFCTKSRRVRALREMSRTLRPGGRIMVYVWAMEQTRRRFNKQDIFIPWHPSAPLGVSTVDAHGKRPPSRQSSLTASSPRLLAGHAMRDGDGCRRSSEDLSNVKFYKSARRFSENDVGRRDAEESSYCENGGVDMRRYICNKIASSNSDFTWGGSSPTPHQSREPTKHASLVNGSPDHGNRCRSSCCGSRGSSSSSVGDLGVKRSSGGDLRMGNRSDSCCIDERSSSSRLYTALEKTFASLFFSRSLDEPLSRSANHHPGSSGSATRPSAEPTRHRSLEHNNCGFFQPSHLPSTQNSSKEGLDDLDQDPASEQMRITESSDEEDDVFLRLRGIDVSVGDRTGFLPARRALGSHEEVSRFVEVLASTSRSKVCLPDLVEAPRRSCTLAGRGMTQITKKPLESHSAGLRFSLKEGDSDSHVWNDSELFNGTARSCEWGRPESPDVTENGEHLRNGTKEDFGNDDADGDCDGEGDGDGGGAEGGETPEEPRWLRYYHVFREGELAQMIERHVAGLRVVCTYYDHANWCVIAQKEGGDDTYVQPNTVPSAHSDARPNGAPNTHSNTRPSPSTPPDLHFSTHSNTHFATHCHAHSHTYPNTHPNTA
ncbi:putative tRNA methyltransferase 9B [Lampetra fluviatilis]